MRALPPAVLGQGAAGRGPAFASAESTRKELDFRPGRKLSLRAGPVLLRLPPLTWSHRG